jgi:hypothetical protein
LIELSDDPKTGQSKEPVFYIAKVVAASGGHLSLLFDGETTATQKYYPRLTSYTVSIDDRVLVAKVSGTYVVLGKIN